MKKVLVSTLGIFFVLMAILYIPYVMAGTVALPKTGQITSYATGDDGDLKAGVAWPEPRFTASGDCVTDNLTGLMWAKNANLANDRKTWQGALDYIASLNVAGGLGGYTDWRLPNVNELESMVNAGQNNPATWLNSQGFTNVQASTYWSSTTYACYTDNAWVVYMVGGFVDAGAKTSYYYVWPVRSSGSFDYSNISVSPTTHDFGIVNAVPADLPKTGQTVSYSAGDDGNLQKGVAWPEGRFSGVSGDCVTDSLTGLMWARNVTLGGYITWQGALNYIASLNSGGGLGGYTDWRLPNRKELRSLINYGQAMSANWLTSQGFTNVQATFYWSSTTYASSTDLAWFVDMYDGLVFASYKTSLNYVWPVRSGGSLDYSDISASPTSHDFGLVSVGSSAARSFTIANNGTGELEISSMALTGGDRSMFSIATDTCSSLTPIIAPDDSCTITATFIPTSGGGKSTSLRITSNDPDTSILSLPLSGTGTTLPVVSITAPDPTASEAGLSTGVFKISRSGNTSKPLTVKYTITGTATSNQDYQKLKTFLVIPAGKSSGTILVKPKADNLKEGDETVILTLKPGSTYKVGTLNTATVTITDDN